MRNESRCFISFSVDASDDSEADHELDHIVKSWIKRQKAFLPKSELEIKIREIVITAESYGGAVLEPHSRKMGDILYFRNWHKNEKRYKKTALVIYTLSEKEKNMPR